MSQSGAFRAARKSSEVTVNDVERCDVSDVNTCFTMIENELLQPKVRFTAALRPSEQTRWGSDHAGTHATTTPPDPTSLV